MLTVAVGAGAAELTVGAGGSAAGAERLGVNAAAVQILRHINEKSVQMVADAAQLGRVGQRAFGVQRLAGLGAEGQRHKLAGALRVHGAVDALLVQQQAVHRVGRGRVGIVAQLAAVHALGRGVGQQVFDARRRRARELPLGVALQREKIQKHLTVEAAVDLLQLKLLAAGLVIDDAQVGAAQLFQRHGIDAVHRADDAHGMARAVVQLHRVNAGRVGVVGVGTVINAQLKRDGLKARLPQIALDEPQQPHQIAADAPDKVLHPQCHAGQVGCGVLVHQIVDERLQFLRCQPLKRLTLAAQGVFQYPVGQRAADVGGQLGLLARRGL